MVVRANRNGQAAWSAHWLHRKMLPRTILIHQRLCVAPLPCSGSSDAAMRYKGPTRDVLAVVAICLLVGLSNAVVPLVAVNAVHPPRAPASPAHPCPLQCSCQEAGTLDSVQVFCLAGALRTVPTGLPSQTTSLDISHNKISHLNSPLSTELSGNKLLNLHLQQNLLTVLNAKCFSNFNNLRTLDLSENVIYSIHVDAFGTLEMLTRLNLSGNRLEHLKHEWFQGLHNLVSLDLSRNRLRELSNVVFWSLHKLEQLRMSENLIESVGLLSLKGLDSLQHLNIARNLIPQIQSGTLRATRNLVTVDLSYNPFVSLSSAFIHASNVTTLAATHLSKLRRITSDSFTGLDNLKRLILSNCGSLETVEEGSFQPLKNLRWLDMRNNNFTTLPSRLFNSLTKLEQVHLSGNPWHCDCRLHWLLLLLRDSVSLHLLSPSATVCDKPASLSNLTVLDSVDKHMVCLNASIVKHTEHAHFRLGSSAVLRCEISGSPRPSLTWVTPHGLYFNWTQEHAASDTNLSTSESKFTLLDSGDLYIRKVQRGDSGFYRCIAANVLGRRGVAIHLTLDYDFLVNVKIVSILVGCVTAASFLLLTLIGIVIQRILNRLGISCGGSPRARQLYCMLESLEHYRCQQLERLREHYNGQVQRIKENCIQQMERLRESYSSQAERIRDIRDYGTTQLDRVRDNYYGQVQRVRDYGTVQIDRLRENYIFQRTRMRKFSAHQLYKLRENYKLQQQHLNKILENLNLESCRSVCMRTDSIVFDSVDMMAPSLDVLPPPILPLLLDELDIVSLDGSAYFTPDNLSEVSPDEVTRCADFPPVVVEGTSAESSDTAVDLDAVPCVAVAECRARMQETVV